jgi:glutaredoxin 3
MNVTIYTTPTCGYCAQAKRFLTRQGIPFVEKNVAADRKAAIEMVRLSGQQGVPVISIDGQVVVGFDQRRLMQLLQRAKPKLGAAVADASSQARKNADLPTSGAYVGRVRSGSPAERAGLRRGDVITGLGGQAIIVADDVERLVSQMPRGRDVALSYVRAGREYDTLVRL